MLCERCFERHATISIIQIINGEKTELHICENCSEGEGIEAIVSNLPQIFTKMILDVLKQKEKEAKRTGGKYAVRKCSSCGYSWEEFRKTGPLGCDKCYVFFKEQIIEIVKQAQGQSLHVELKQESKRSFETAEDKSTLLENALQKAVQNEEYEKAAKLRDKIRSLK